MKTSFFYQTKAEYKKALAIVNELNVEVRERKRIRYNAIQITTKYLDAQLKTQMNIPNTKPGKKKYEGIIHGNKSVLSSIGIDIPRILLRNGFNLVPKMPSRQKHEGEKTTKNVVLKSETELMAIISVFDVAFGKSNWKITGGPKHMKKILKNIELSEDGNSVGFSWFRQEYPNGVPAKINVYRENADIDKYLFKVKLKV